MLNKSHINGAMLPGTLWLEDLTDGGRWCAKCKLELTDTVWIIAGGDFHQSCPVCFKEECPNTPNVISDRGCNGFECSSEGSVDCVRCQKFFCMWHVGKLSITGAFICKTCADNKSTPINKLPLKLDGYACAGGGECEEVGDYQCAACETWVCTNHRSMVNPLLCVHCTRVYD